MTPLAAILDDYALLDSEDRYRLLIELGRSLEPMPDALKTDATKVRGCSASVWVYPTRTDDGRLHFLADSNAAITKGVVALVLAVVQDRAPGEIEPRDNVETVQLKEEVKQLKQRLQTLERIAVDKENSLSREIENLRDR